MSAIELPVVAPAALPPCRWRGGPVGPGRYGCASPKLMVGPRGVPAASCRGCYCADHGPAAARPAATAKVFDCAHRGAKLRSLGEGCQTCSVFACGVHGECLIYPHFRGPDLKTCQGCGEYQKKAAGPAPGRRHLLCHVLPVAGTGTWQRNLDQLLWRMPLFDGRKVVAVATGTADDTTTGRGNLPLDPPDAVREYLDGSGAEFVEVANDPALREVATWAPLWDRLADRAGTSDVAFYCHTKGVARPFDPGTTVHTWARLMYSGLLDFWPEVGADLGRHPLTGMFKKVGTGFAGSRSAWHYSGSFFWARVSEVFAAGRVHQIDRRWTGTEAWPGLHFAPGDAGCVFHPGRVPGLDLYKFAYVRDRVLPEFRRWSAAARRTQWT